jgi:hypothetical protein
MSDLMTTSPAMRAKSPSSPWLYRKHLLVSDTSQHKLLRWWSRNRSTAIDQHGTAPGDSRVGAGILQAKVDVLPVLTALLHWFALAARVDHA